MRDIYWSSEGMQFFIKRSKTDQMGKGTTICIGRTESRHTCAVAAIQECSLSRGDSGATTLHLPVPAAHPAIRPSGATDICEDTTTGRLDQALQSLRGREAPDTSPRLTPPSSPAHAPPPATVSERQPVVWGCQPLPSPPATAEPTPPTPPPSPGLPPPPARIPGTLARITIDPENMDQTLRQPFHEELLPFAGGRLGYYEWIAFEAVLERWTKTINDMVTALRRRPPNPTSQWARRRWRLKQEEQEGHPPSLAPDLQIDPSLSADEQDQTSTNNRASGRAEGRPGQETMAGGRVR
ncbi:hypothetical protein EMCRGX_G005480 [Ephydatia muelleri]